MSSSTLFTAMIVGRPGAGPTPRTTKADRLWNVWIRQRILTQDRSRGDSQLRHWRRRDPKEIRQKRIDAMRAEIGSPSAQRAMARGDGAFARYGKTL
jgi:hypothetical protein